MLGVVAKYVLNRVGGVAAFSVQQWHSAVQESQVTQPGEQVQRIATRILQAPVATCSEMACCSWGFAAQGLAQNMWEWLCQCFPKPAGQPLGLYVAAPRHVSWHRLAHPIT